MIDIFQNPFSSTDIKLTRPSAGASSQVASGGQSKSSSLSIKDEYLPSASASSGTYMRSSMLTVPSTREETAPSGKVTDKMREEMACGDGYWNSMSLLPIAYQTLHEIWQQVLDEKGIDALDDSVGYTTGWCINPDGIFMFKPDVSGEHGCDPEFAKEICLALEDALNSSSLNLKDNPHLFTRDFLPLDYDPAQWGRTFDREEWLSKPLPDFGGFVEDLRSDILKEFENLKIVDFSMKIDDQGKLTFTNVQTNGPVTGAQAMARMNRSLTAEIEKKAEYLGMLMLAAKAIDGDVLVEGTILEPLIDDPKSGMPQFKHEILLTSGTNYKVVRAAERPNRGA